MAQNAEFNKLWFFSRVWKVWALGFDGGVMKKAKITKLKRERMADFDAIDWFLAIDCCLP